MTAPSEQGEKVKDGGPAFPRVTEYRKFVSGDDYERFEETVGFQGMTLRDYFAAAALTGIMAACADAKIEPDEEDFDYAARLSFLQADAMLEARKKGAPNV